MEMKKITQIIRRVLKPNKQVIASIFCCINLLCLPFAEAHSIQRTTSRSTEIGSHSKHDSGIHVSSDDIFSDNLFNGTDFDALMRGEFNENFNETIREHLLARTAVIQRNSRSSHISNEMYRQLLAKLRERSHERHREMPTSCKRNTAEFCPYVSGRDNISDHFRTRALAPFHYWRDPSSGSRRKCCSCSLCLNPFNRTQSLPTYEVRSIKRDNVTVGCMCFRV